MRPLLVTRSALVLSVAAVGCSSATQTGQTSIATQAGAGEVGPAFLQWTGKFKSVHTANASATEVSSFSVASGNVRLTAPDDRQMHVEMVVNGPSDLNGDFRWSLSPGACRSGTIPLMPVNTFPEVHLSQGHGELDRIISLPLPTAGSYHVNVYTADGVDETDVMACSELTLSQRADNR